MTKNALVNEKANLRKLRISIFLENTIFLRELRWPDGIKCVYCGSGHVVKFGSQRKHVNRYLCRKCHKTFSDLAGTIFENSKMKLNEWFYIARELQRNTSINQIHKDLGREYDNVHMQQGR